MVVLPAGATRAWGERGGGQPVEAAPAGCCAGRGITTGDAPSCSTRHAAGDTHLGSRRAALAVTPAHGKPPAKEVLPQRPNAGWCEWEVGTGGGWRGQRPLVPTATGYSGGNEPEGRQKRAGGRQRACFPARAPLPSAFLFRLALLEGRPASWRPGRDCVGKPASPYPDRGNTVTPPPREETPVRPERQEPGQHQRLLSARRGGNQGLLTPSPSTALCAHRGSGG